MAEALAATRFFVPGTAQVNGASSSQANILSGTINQAPDMNKAWIAWGVSATAPTTYGDLTSPTLMKVVAADNVSWILNGGNYDVRFSTNTGAPPAAAPGDKVWLLLFNKTGTPISGDAPDAVAGPFVAV